MKKRKLGFTLIELLAVIVVIVVVLAITIPIISNMIETVKKEAFKATAYSIADSGRLLMAHQDDIEYEEFYYLDGVQYNATDLKLDYTGDGPKTGVVILNENDKVAMAIHNGTYCATKSADTNKITIDETVPEDCKAYNIINTCDTWEQIALKYDVNLNDLLEENNVTDTNGSTCGLNIKIPLTSTSTDNNYASDGESKIYYKTYYSVGYTTYSESFTSTSYEYTIKLGVLPLNISNIEAVRVTTQSVFESLDDFKRYITKKNMGEVIWPGEVNPAEIDIDQASIFKDHALRNTNMSADDVTVQCDEVECTASINITVNNMNNVSPNTINEIPIAYLPVKFTVEFNGEADTCTVKSITDAVPGTLAGTGTTTDPYLVESIEDLVALSNNVNAGNTYSGKYIAFTNSFDFSNKRSYKDFSTTAYGDINGNNTIEGLQVELTTGAGFNPIGNGTTKFSGRVLGNSNCIYDLYINRPSSSYVAFIGYNNGGSITALNLKDINITGKDYTGGLVGYVYNGTVNDNVVTGEVTGNNNVGIALGYFRSSDKSNTATSIVVEGNVTGLDYIGGLIGGASAYYGRNTITGINKGGVISSTGTNVARNIGYIKNDSAGSHTLSSLALGSTLVNGSTVTNNSQTTIQGASIASLSELSDLNLVEVGLDTHIGGDYDGNGYYWYGDASGNLIRQSIADYQVAFTLTGSGTVADPYLVGSYDDLVQAQLKIGSFFMLTSDIDMTGKPNFMLGSYMNPFKGTFDGNGKNINNFTLNLPEIAYVGFFGTNTGTIKNLTLNNSTVTGVNYTGVIAGTNTGTVSLVKVNNVDVNGEHNTGGILGYNSGLITASDAVNVDVTGLDQTGGLVGYNYNGSANDNTVTGKVVGNNAVGLGIGYFRSSDDSNSVTSFVVDGDVVGANYVGGLVGRSAAYYGRNTITGINKGGSITSTGANVARNIGITSNESAGSHTISSIALGTITVNGSTTTSTSQTSTQGANIATLSQLSDINLVEVGLDTHIGGDYDGNGYYWYGDASGNLIRQSITDYSIVFGLTGAGTAADPYLIYDYSDLVEAQLKLGSVFKLMADIDMNGKANFMLGSYMNPFKGTFDGNGKNINNFTLNLPEIAYVGFFGTNTGTIKNLTLNNSTVTGVNYTGIIAGTNTGTVSLVKVNNVDVNGEHNTGGILGYNSGLITASDAVNVDVTGLDQTGGLVGYNYNGSANDNTVTGRVVGSNSVGLGIGYFRSSDKSNNVTSLLVDGDVVGANYVGGLVGRSAAYYGRNTITGINKGGSITSTGANVARNIGITSNESAGSHTISSIALGAITVNGSTTTSTSQTSTQGANIATLSQLSDINLVEVGLDTHIGGDYDGNGYYWYGDASGNLIRQSITDYSIVFNLTGAGTAADPYLIYDYSDLVEAQLKLGSVFKLMANIDMNGKANFMLGSYMNPFKGTFNGNNFTVSNFTLNLPQIAYVGFFGTNTGTIQNLNFNNANITGVNYTGTVAGTNSGTFNTLTLNSINVVGEHYTGGVAGYNSGVITVSDANNVDITGLDQTGGLVGYVYNGSIYDNTVNGSVTGSNQVGLAVGYLRSSDKSNSVTSVITEGIVTGINNVGGIIGRAAAYYGRNTITGINKGTTVISTGTNVARNIGNVANESAGSHTLSTLVLASTTVNGSAVENNSQTSTQGADIASLTKLSDINLVEVGLDTHIGGDYDGNGYYWYGDASGNLIRQSIAGYSIVFSLTGAGTAADPYLIYDYSDLVEAQLKLGSIYKLMANIDMSGKNNFMLGSYMNPFKGTFNGNNFTISNFTLNLPQIGYVGFFGTNTGTIQYLKFNNANITGANYTGTLSGTNSGTILLADMNQLTVNGVHYTGGVSGYSSGTIKGTKLAGININGSDHTGGLVGQVSNGSMYDNVVSGNVTGNNYIALAAGYFNSSDKSNKITNTIVEGNVSGANYVGGLVGRSYAYYGRNTITGISRGGTITSGGTNVGRTIGNYTNASGGSHTLNTSGINTILVNDSVVTSTSSSSLHGLDITSSDLSSTTTYTDRGFNFTDEVQEYIWYIDGGVAKFREGNL